MKHGEIAVIVLAGGQGKRTGGHKQFRRFGSKLLVFHCLDAFEKARLKHETIVVVPPAKKRDAARLIRARFPSAHIVSGGTTRRWSTHNGLRYAKNLRDAGLPIKYVIVHDAARPLITPHTIRNVAKSMQRWGGAVTGTPSNGIPLSVKHGFVTNVFNKRRYGMYDGTTPQCFRFDALWHAYEKTKHMKGVDVAADNLEILKAAHSTLRIKMIDAHPNHKITYAEDFRLVEPLLARRR